MSRITEAHIDLLNSLDHGGEMHAYELGVAQSVSKMLALLKRRGLVRKRVVAEGQSALWSIADEGRASLASSTAPEAQPKNG